MSEDRDILIALATFNRPEGLRKLLESLESQDFGETLRVVVVDNAPVAMMREGYQSQRLAMNFDHEPQPGISAARNRALEHAKAGSLVLFIDDDEFAPPHWVSSLVRVWNQTGAAAVHGGVDYMFQTPVPTWIAEGGYFISPGLREGAALPFAATNNLLLDLEALRRLGIIAPYFDDRFGLTGGSDIHLTSRISAAGGKIVWTDTANVVESVPSDRLTRAWVVKRAIRTGETHARVRIDLARDRKAAQLQMVLEGIARMSSGVLGLCWAVLRRRDGARGRALRRVARGIGLIRAAAGRFQVEYSRRVAKL